MYGLGSAGLLLLVGRSVALTVNLCCPEGTVNEKNANYDYDALDYGDPSTWPTICQEHPIEKLVDEDLDLEYVGGKTRFQCRKNEGRMYLEPWDSPEVLETKVLPTGELQVTTQNKTLKYQHQDFCMFFSTIPNEYSEEPFEEGTIRKYFASCVHELTEEEMENEAFVQHNYPVLIFLSSMFILATLVIYCFMKQNRAKLFGKLTIAFLINLFIAFFLTGVRYSLNFPNNRETINLTGCKVLGYIVQHTWIAFFLWMSAMSINITHCFNNIFHRHNQQDSKQTRALILNILFAQGVPTFITIITLLMDTLRPEDQVLPNMGQYSCFVGQEYSEPPVPYFKTAEFLYFYLFIVLVVITNIICFIITGVNLTSHWAQMKQMEQTQKSTILSQLRIIANLFIIMGTPWVFEVVSAYVKHTYPTNSWTTTIGFVLDVIILLQGVLIFIALVCKVQVYHSMKASLTRTSSGGQAVSKTSTSSMASSRKPSTGRTPKVHV